jgi:hypothetical protein
LPAPRLGCRGVKTEASLGRSKQHSQPSWGRPRYSAVRRALSYCPPIFRTGTGKLRCSGCVCCPGSGGAGPILQPSRLSYSASGGSKHPSRSQDRRGRWKNPKGGDGGRRPAHPAGPRIARHHSLPRRRSPGCPGESLAFASAPKRRGLCRSGAHRKGAHSSAFRSRWWAGSRTGLSARAGGGARGRWYSSRAANCLDPRTPKSKGCHRP